MICPLWSYTDDKRLTLVQESNDEFKGHIWKAIIAEAGQTGVA